VSASNLTLLKAFDARVEEIDGSLEGHVVVSGTPSAPRAEGHLRLRGGRLELALHEHLLHLLLADVLLQDLPVGGQGEPLAGQRLLKRRLAAEGLGPSGELLLHDAGDPRLVHREEGVLGGGLEHQEPVDGALEELPEERLLPGGVLGQLPTLERHPLDVLLDLGGEDGRIADDGHHLVHHVAVVGTELGGGGGDGEGPGGQGRQEREEAGDSHHGRS